MGRHAVALLGALDVACANTQAVATATEQAFDRHPDPEIIISFAGLGRLIGVRGWPSWVMTDPLAAAKGGQGLRRRHPPSPTLAARACWSTIVA
jgi:hypothetical protein